MTWTSRFLAVPTARLRSDDDVQASPKASAQHMREYMSNVPAVYKCICEGAGPAQFDAMRGSSDPQLKAVGDAYHHLFSPAGVDHRIEAELVDGKGLVVTRGRHRVEAAKQLVLPYVPVHVRTPDDRTLQAITRTCEVEVEAGVPTVVEAQRRLDAEHRAARDRADGRVIRGETHNESRRPDSQSNSVATPDRANARRERTR